MPIQFHLTQKKSVCQQPVCGLQHCCQIWLEPSLSFHWNLDINLSRIVGSRALRSLLQKLWYMVPLRLKDRATPTFAGSKPDLPCYLEDKNLDKTSLRELAFTIIHCLFLSLLFPLQTNQPVSSVYDGICHLYFWVSWHLYLLANSTQAMKVLTQDHLDLLSSQVKQPWWASSGSHNFSSEIPTQRYLLFH